MEGLVRYIKSFDGTTYISGTEIIKIKTIEYSNYLLNAMEVLKNENDILLVYSITGLTTKNVLVPYIAEAKEKVLNGVTYTYYDYSPEAFIGVKCNVKLLHSKNNFTLHNLLFSIIKDFDLHLTSWNDDSGEFIKHNSGNKEISFLNIEEARVCFNLNYDFSIRLKNISSCISQIDSYGIQIINTNIEEIK